MIKILLVEQEAAAQTQLAANFTHEGYDVVISGNGFDAVTTAQIEEPDVIVMSMNLPRLNGWQAAEQLKASAYTQNIPIIAMTDENSIENTRKCLLVGCDTRIVKPVHPKLIVQEIEMLLCVNGIS
ncbi:MAG: response regulator [Chloroflexi bacterium]|nr:MAG: response regulator [Chloroflexota bacterium]